jgi:hypothetical protein
MKTKFTIFFFLGFAMVLTSCWRKSESAGPDKLNIFVMSKSMSDALFAKILLTEIRADRLTNAIETLEFSIDCSVVEMEHTNHCDAATQQQILQTLRLVKEYRQQYPRKSEAVIGEGDELKQNLKTAQDAKDYLERVR